MCNASIVLPISALIRFRRVRKQFISGPYMTLKRCSQVSVDVAVDTKQQTMGSVAFPISRQALDEISSLSQGRINYVQLSIGNACE